MFGNFKNFNFNKLQKVTITSKLKRINYHANKNLNKVLP